MHALVLNGQIVRFHDFADGDVPTLAPNKGTWIEVVVQPMPDHDPVTHRVQEATVLLNGVPTLTRTVEARIVPVPQSVTPRQARTALRQAGLLSAVNAAVAATGEQAQIDWDFALEIRRDNALIASMAADLELTDEQIDNLFRAAAQVV